MNKQQRDKKLKELQKIALSSSQLQENTEQQLPIVTYNQIYHWSIPELLANGACIILYLWEQSYGHWTVLIDHPDEDGAVEYFDPYGKAPDYWMSKNSDEKNEELGQHSPYLLNKIIQSNQEWYYNQFPFQDENKSDDILSCGRHCLVRNWLRHLSLADYKKFLTDVKNEYKLNTYDEVVTMLTKHIDEQH